MNQNCKSRQKMRGCSSSDLPGTGYRFVNGGRAMLAVFLDSQLPYSMLSAEEKLAHDLSRNSLLAESSSEYGLQTKE